MGIGEKRDMVIFAVDAESEKAAPSVTMTGSHCPV
jgi:hypothetical protein